MPEPGLDPARVPACHRCQAPAIVERDHYGLLHVTWRHEYDCPVPGSTAERLHLDALLAGAWTGGRS